MNLHSIMAGTLTAWAWLTPVGGNRKPLGRGQFEHLYLVERGTPPPLPTGDETEYTQLAMQNRRRYWSPFRDLPHDQAKTPLCGPIKTAAQWATLTSHAWQANGNCQNCRSEAIKRGLQDQHIAEVRTRDPWNNLTRQDRDTTPDPVTGT
jgi:hypothetical protein